MYKTNAKHTQTHPHNDNKNTLAHTNTNIHTNTHISKLSHTNIYRYTQEHRNNKEIHNEQREKIDLYIHFIDRVSDLRRQ